MKSPMITAASYIKPEEKGNYTDLQVLRSGGGYYIGTMYVEKDETGKIIWQEPGSRDSDYFNTQEEAEAALAALRLGGEDAPILRDHP